MTPIGWMFCCRLTEGEILTEVYRGKQKEKKLPDYRLPSHPHVAPTPLYTTEPAARQSPSLQASFEAVSPNF